MCWSAIKIIPYILYSNPSEIKSKNEKMLFSFCKWFLLLFFHQFALILLTVALFAHSLLTFLSSFHSLNTHFAKTYSLLFSSHSLSILKKNSFSTTLFIFFLHVFFSMHLGKFVFLFHSQFFHSLRIYKLILDKIFPLSQHSFCCFAFNSPFMHSQSFHFFGIRFFL